MKLKKLIISSIYISATIMFMVGCGNRGKVVILDDAQASLLFESAIVTVTDPEFEFKNYIIVLKTDTESMVIQDTKYREYIIKTPGSTKYYSRGDAYIVENKVKKNDEAPLSFELFEEEAQRVFKVIQSVLKSRDVECIGAQTFNGILWLDGPDCVICSIKQDRIRDFDFEESIDEVSLYLFSQDGRFLEVELRAKSSTEDITIKYKMGHITYSIGIAGD